MIKIFVVVLSGRNDRLTFLVITASTRYFSCLESIAFLMARRSPHYSFLLTLLDTSDLVK